MKAVLLFLMCFYIIILELMHNVAEARGTHSLKKAVLREEEPPWLQELKVFVKSIVQLFGRETVLQMLQPTIKVLEVKHNVKILDIDMDQYGNVLVSISGAKIQTDNKTPAPDDGPFSTVLK